jgi:hypothetical protein
MDENKEGTYEVLEKAMKQCATMAAEQKVTSLAALQLSQAACNLANTMSTYQSIKQN